MSYILHRLPTYDDLLVVFMKRNLNDIHQSEKRIGWSCNGVEINKYKRENLLQLVPADIRGVSREIKYGAWNFQKRKIAHSFELEYEDLSVHELWYPKEERTGWLGGQITPTNKNF